MKPKSDLFNLCADIVRTTTAVQLAAAAHEPPRKTVAASLVRTAPEPKIIAKLFGTCVELPNGDFTWTLTLDATGHKVVMEGSANQKLAELMKATCKASQIARDALASVETPNQRVA